MKKKVYCSTKCSVGFASTGLTIALPKQKLYKASSKHGNTQISNSLQYIAGRFTVRYQLMGGTSMVMVDVSEKPEVFRQATASGSIRLRPETIELIRKGTIAKGDPLQTAKTAGILAAKKTSDLIPLCHPLPLTNVRVETRIIDKYRVQVTATVKTKAQTGVEMESLTAVAVSLLTIWDMVKQYEKDAEGQYPSTNIQDIHVVKKLKENSLQKALKK